MSLRLRHMDEKKSDRAEKRRERGEGGGGEGDHKEEGESGEVVEREPAARMRGVME